MLTEKWVKQVIWPPYVKSFDLNVTGLAWARHPTSTHPKAAIQEMIPFKDATIRASKGYGHSFPLSFFGSLPYETDTKNMLIFVYFQYYFLYNWLAVINNVSLRIMLTNDGDLSKKNE